MKDPHSKGSALIITLVVLVLLTITVVGLTELMRLERYSAQSYVEEARAEQFARMGVERTIATLQQETSTPGRNWASQPGQLIVPNEESTDPTLARVAPLSSGTPSNASDTSTFININEPTFRDPAKNLITEQLSSSTGGDTILPLRWIYVREKGDLEESETPDTSNATNPIVGRFAYWADDDSAKINYNLAWTREAINPATAGNPTKISLTALSGFSSDMANALHSFITTDNYVSIANRFFETSNDAKSLEPDAPGIADAVSQNRFSLTHFNHSPDTTFFDEPRIVLTTQKGRAGNRPFLDIGSNDPGDTENVDPVKLNETLNLLVSYLKRVDWPVAPGSSFQNKYYQGDENRLTQIALNIIDYVRLKETATTLVPPLRGEKPPGKDLTLGLASTANAFMGVGRGPQITEMGLWVGPTANAQGNYDAKAVIELYLPENFGIEEMDLTKISLNCEAAYGGQKSFTVNFSPLDKSYISGVDPKHFKKGEYAVVTVPITGVQIPSSRANLKSGQLRIAVGDAPRIDIAPLLGSKANFPTTTIDAGIEIAGISSIEVDDPRVNSHKNDWIASTGNGSKRNTFGAKNSISTIGKNPATSASPQQDLDANGKISDASLYLPPPKTKIGNLDGLVASSAELGFVCTGMESAAKAGVPWRTLRLQPSSADASIVPDWAILDLFTVPLDTPEAAKDILNPYPNAVGGRININSQIEPFHTERLSPLVALLLKTKKNFTSSEVMSKDEATEVARNISERVLAEHGKAYGYGPGYDSLGEIAEIKGVADTGEASEEMIREIGSLVTVRGNVFTIYTAGQAIKQTTTGRLIVTAEQRRQTIIERYSELTNASTPNDSSDDIYEVRFRVLSNNALSP